MCFYFVLITEIESSLIPSSYKFVKSAVQDLAITVETVGGHFSVLPWICLFAVRMTFTHILPTA